MGNRDEPVMDEESALYVCFFLFHQGFITVKRVTLKNEQCKVSNSTIEFHVSC